MTKLQFKVGQHVKYTDTYLTQVCGDKERNRMTGRIGKVTGYRGGAHEPIVLFPKVGRFKELKLYEVSLNAIEAVSAPQAPKVMLAPASAAALRSLLSADQPRQEFNPGVAKRLLTETFVVSLNLRSPYATHKGATIEHFRITDAGRDYLAQDKEQ